MAARNPVVWFEIYVDDMARAVSFYEQVFQFKLTKMGPPEDLTMEMMAFPSDMESAGMASGTLVKMDGFPAGGSGTIVYFFSQDCSKEAARVANAGGKLLRPKESLGEYGFMALVADSEGNTIGIHSMG